MNTEELKRQARRITYRTMRWGQNHVPPGVRTVLGALFCVGGVFGFLPVLGFWMLPLGLAFIALDIPPLRKRVDAWVDRLQAHVERDAIQDGDEEPTSSQ